MTRTIAWKPGFRRWKSNKQARDILTVHIFCIGLDETTAKTYFLIVPFYCSVMLSFNGSQQRKCKL